MDLLTTFEHLIAKYGGRHQLYKDVLIELNSSYKAHILPSEKQPPLLTPYQRVKEKEFKRILQETS